MGLKKEGADLPPGDDGIEKALYGAITAPFSVHREILSIVTRPVIASSANPMRVNCAIVVVDKSGFKQVNSDIISAMGGCPFSVMGSLIHNFRTSALLFQPFILAKVLLYEGNIRNSVHFRTDEYILANQNY